MKQTYILFFLMLLTFCTSQNTGAQNNSANNPYKNTAIEGLRIYPNPVDTKNTILNITSNTSSTKYVRVFTVLGKQVLAASVTGTTLNVSALKKGIYIITITENNMSTSKKLILQ